MTINNIPEILYNKLKKLPYESNRRYPFLQRKLVTEQSITVIKGRQFVWSTK